MPPRRATREIHFAKPVEYQGKEYRSITLREPTAGEFIDASDKRGLAGTMRLMAVVSDVMEQAVRKMPVSALMEADRFFADFLMPAPETPES